MNPCPCGYAGHPSIPCTDTPQQISNYRRKLSGPLLDRFDLHVEVASQSSSIIFSNEARVESSETVLERVKKARSMQLNRQKKLNCQLEGKELLEACQLENQTQAFLEGAMDKLNLSARATNRILKVSRTLADLNECKTVTVQHLSEALSYRSLDRKAQSTLP